MSKIKKIFAVCLFMAILVGVGTFTSAANTSGILGQNSVGEPVTRVQMRLRELDYLYFKATGSYKGMTVNAIIHFQQAAGMPADGSTGEQTQNTLFSPRAVRSPISVSVHIPIGPSLQGSAKVHGALTSWSDVKKSIVLNKSYIVTDYNTGKTFYMTYVGGKNHAEMECTTAEDTKTFLSVFGGTYNFSKRPVVIAIGSTDVAASLYGYPHGSSAIKANDMSGHVCLYFQGGTSHVGNVADVEHQRQIYIASGA